jgi:hypothetical protein
MVKILNEETNIEDTDFDLKEDFDLLKNNFYKDNRTQESVSTVPTYIPKTFLEQFVLYDDGTNQRLYVYVNGAWKNATLT